MSAPAPKHILPATLAMGVHYDIWPREGWLGAFTERQADGAIPNGTRVRKVREDPGGDMTPLGTLGRVLGSITHPTAGVIFYFVEWDGAPKRASGCVDWKIESAG